MKVFTTLQFKCNQQHIMISVVWAVSLKSWCLPFLGTVQPVSMIYPSSFNVSGFSHQLVESNIFKSLCDKIPRILLQAQVKVTSYQSGITWTLKLDHIIQNNNKI